MKKRSLPGWGPYLWLTKLINQCLCGWYCLAWISNSFLIYLKATMLLSAVCLTHSDINNIIKHFVFLNKSLEHLSVITVSLHWIIAWVKFISKYSSFSALSFPLSSATVSVTSFVLVHSLCTGDWQSISVERYTLRGENWNNYVHLYRECLMKELPGELISPVFEHLTCLITNLITSSQVSTLLEIYKRVIFINTLCFHQRPIRSHESDVCLHVIVSVCWDRDLE